MNRVSGSFLSVSSLPSPYGIGTLGRAAYVYVDFLEAAGQKLWQVLPVGPAGSGDSPYSSPSSYLGNPLYIDPELLLEDGLVTKEELAALPQPEDLRHVDYDSVRAGRRQLLRAACDRFRARFPEQLEAYRRANPVPEQHCLFLACRDMFDGKSWLEWPEELRLRKDPRIVASYLEALRTEVDRYLCEQLLFDRQWNALLAYAHAHGVELLGDIPVYVPLDSADVWLEPWFFQLDETNMPVRVSGVPPDAFEAEGQLWGNPLYDWEAMQRDGFGWWIRRIDAAGRRYDRIRIDHFRGFESYWSVPADAKTAKEGRWEKGPGLALLSVLNGWFPQLRFVAEDLGSLTPAVHELRNACGWPGMCVLQFAFDPASPGPYLPHNHVPHSLVYTGTHDNRTLREWAESLPAEQELYVRDYLGLAADASLPEAVLRAGMASVAEIFLCPVQDWLGLGKGCEMNSPGTPSGCWRFRLLPGECTPELAAHIRRLTELYGRL